MDKVREKQKIIAEVNRVSARCMRIIMYFLLVFFSFMLILNKYDALFLGILTAACLFISLIPILIVNILKFDKSILTKHIIIICTVIITGIYITELTYYAFPMMLFPILIASLYYNRTFILYTSLLETAMVVIAEFIQVNYKTIVSIEGKKDYIEVLMNFTIPSILIILFMSFIAYFIVDRNALMIDRNIETALITVENEKGLCFAFSEISENKSKLTGEHIKRVAEYTKILGRASGFDEEYVDKLATAAMMHDIGKLFISDDILDKPDRLTDEEYQIMKNHVLYGEALLQKCPGEVMHLAMIIAKEHHERWDGRGYLGMKGEEIAYISRIVAVCDVFDALTAERMYKKGWSLEDTYNEIITNSGKQFDPKVVKLFIQNFDKFKEIREKIPDMKIY
ncbi:HD domain-containing protein [Eubacterium ruminantium]|uniref:HD domain-containing protein n=1 Tax=Eubacterium ruminantium TaxID=42322 RepID=A0A1T4M0E4_9FIRM|nr:HD-GYP domain-containing protein [Eubacterium ruminantium]SCW38048.1 HD domain-containing protein [Eubacterium ruminantium]SDM45533.1 HD domain-containing protein [Eubacterium ruminantium]SJZ60453.1 HD domain-containing protein [Eubacterium ruminantium]